MASRIDRQTVDLSKYPDLVVIYLGLRVRKLTGIKRLSIGKAPRVCAIYCDLAGAAQAVPYQRHAKQLLLCNEREFTRQTRYQHRYIDPTCMIADENISLRSVQVRQPLRFQPNAANP